MVTLELASRWLKQHSASERSFASALREFFANQASRAAREAESIHGLSADQVALIFNADAEHAELMPLVRRNLAALMVAGAESTLERREAQKSFNLFDAEAMERFGLDAADVARLFGETLPQPVRDRIRAALDETSQQPYWRAIQDGVSADIAGIIRESIDAGDSPHTMAKRIREQLGGDDARRRSKVIARSETTCSLNAGHQAALEGIADSGDILGKEWLAIGDEDTRATHADANGQVVAVKANFVIGGFETPYPGHWSLPAQERVNCRCTTVGAFAE